jgi:hypothetical protein
MPNQTPPAPPASPTAGMGTQTLRVVLIAGGAVIADRFMHSETAIIAVMAGVTAAVTFGVGLWDRWRSNVEKLTLHNIIRDLSGGVIQ